MMNSRESQLFVKWMALIWGAWAATFSVVFLSDIKNLHSFWLSFLIVSVDLVLLILIFWKLFFRSQRVGILGIFKLVCLGFLAITLRQFEDDQMKGALAGLSFLMIGPLGAAWIKIHYFKKKS